MSRTYECVHGHHIHIDYSPKQLCKLERKARKRGVPTAMAKDINEYANLTLYEISGEWDVNVVDLLRALVPVAVMRDMKGRK